ncbi:MAG: hypothetical protein ACTMH4_14290 [Sphingobacterium sp.]
MANFIANPLPIIMGKYVFVILSSLILMSCGGNQKFAEEKARVLIMRLVITKN